MASKSVDLSADVYTKLDTGTETALLVQNRMQVKMLLVFSATLPVPSAPGDFVIAPGQAIARGSMTGDMYGKELGEGGGLVTVGE